MRYRQLDANRDYVFGYAPSFLADSPETVRQAVITRIRLHAQEWFLDLREGLDLTNILGYGTQALRDREIQRRILGTPGVQGITSYASQVDPVTRAYNVQATIATIYGPITINEAL